jgi:hypothetical protein
MLRGFSSLSGKGNGKGVSPDFSKAKIGNRPRLLLAALLAGFLLSVTSGCALILPDVSHEPVIHNPFPQLSKVAIAPFFNQSDEKTVDGRKFALAYFTELQAVPGFEVAPLGVVEEAILANHVDLSHPGEARRLANILGVDAVVIGSVTDYSPYYPPRCGLRVEWYAANPGFHEIPPGYGLPWGTPEEEFIPAPLVFESEFALAKAQLATQTPTCEMQSANPPVLPPQPAEPAPFPGAPSEHPAGQDAGKKEMRGTDTSPPRGDATKPSAKAKNRDDTGHVARAFYDESGKVEELPPSASTAGTPSPPVQSAPAASGSTTGAIVARAPLPPGWPDERGFIPPPPSPVRPACCPTNGPVMTHTRIYQGNDGEFTEALASYYHFRDDARFGGWQNYLTRSDDFVRFCCHMHIAEMLSARGGASETRVVWSWSDCR